MGQVIYTYGEMGNSLFSKILKDEWKAFETGNRILERIYADYPDSHTREEMLRLVQEQVWNLFLEHFPWIGSFAEPDCSVNPGDLGWGMFCYLEELTGLVKTYHLDALDEATEHVVERLAAHILGKGTVTAAAEDLQMDKNRLNRLFRKHTGVSASEYCRMLKLERASLLLSRERRSVSEAAQILGFSTEDSFVKIFREQFGCRPEQYLREA